MEERQPVSFRIALIERGVRGVLLVTTTSTAFETIWPTQLTDASQYLRKYLALDLRLRTGDYSKFQ